MNPRVVGFASPPSILTTRPFSTVTSRVQESGQSSGQAVRTVEWPHVTSDSAAEALRGMADYRTPSTPFWPRGTVDSHSSEGIRGGAQKKSPHANAACGDG